MQDSPHPPCSPQQGGHMQTTFWERSLTHAKSQIVPGLVWERISWSKPKPWQCLFYLMAEVIWVLVPGNTAWSRFQIISVRNAPLCCETCPGAISAWKSLATVLRPSEVGKHEASGLTKSSGLLVSSEQRDDVSSKGDVSAPSRA